MTTAAIYARTSTVQNSITDDLRRQIDHAKAYAAEQGWAVPEEHIYVDAVPEEHIYVDAGVGGAKFEQRRGFWRLMGVVKPRPPFQVLLMAEMSRLGRDPIKTAHALEQIVEAGVRVCFYGED